MFTSQLMNPCRLLGIVAPSTVCKLFHIRVCVKELDVHYRDGTLPVFVFQY